MSPVKYDIFGRKVGSHYLAVAVLSTIFAGIGYASSGPKKVAGASPAINASSKEEGDFIQQFLAENDKSPAKH